MKSRAGIAAIAVTSVFWVAHPLQAAAQETGRRSAAVASFESGRLPEAKAAFTAALRADAADARALMYLGRIAIREGRTSEATKMLERAARLAADDPQIQHWLGRAYAQEALQAGMLRRAALAGRIRRAFERAIALDPDLVDARADLLQFHLVAPGFMGGSITRARAEQREIAARDPSRGRVAAAMLAEHEGDRAEAERELLAAIRAFPDSAAAYYVLGSLYQRTDRAEQAMELYERLLVRRPDETLAHYQIGRAASISGVRLDAGERALRTYLRSPQREITPLPAAARYRLGLVYERSGDPERARVEFETVLRLSPRHSGARSALARLSGS